MEVFIIAIWAAALGLFIFLAIEMVGNRAAMRRARKAAARKFHEFEKDHRFDKELQKWVRKVDGVVVQTEAPRSRGALIFGIVVLILWELYWLSEVRNAESLSDVPRFFLFVMVVVVPFIVFWVARTARG